MFVDCWLNTEHQIQYWKLLCAVCRVQYALIIKSKYFLSNHGIYTWYVYCISCKCKEFVGWAIKMHTLSVKRDMRYAMLNRLHLPIQLNGIHIQILYSLSSLHCLFSLVFFFDISSFSPFFFTICIIDKLWCMDCATPCRCQNIRQPKELLFLFVKLLNKRTRAHFYFQLKCKHFMNVCLLFGFGWMFGCCSHSVAKRTCLYIMHTSIHNINIFRLLSLTHWLVAFSIYGHCLHLQSFF